MSAPPNLEGKTQMSVVPMKKINPSHHKPQYIHTTPKPKVKPYFEPNELTKLGYTVDQMGDTKYRINGFIEIDLRSLRFVDFMKNTSGYIFTAQELQKPTPLNINSAVRKIIKSH